MNKESINSLNRTVLELEVQLNERERFLVETHRKEREEDARNFSKHLSEEIKRQHVNCALVILNF